MKTYFALALLFGTAVLGVPCHAVAKSRGHSPAVAGAKPNPRVYLIARGDGGRQGAKIGCNDSLVAYGTRIPANIAGLRASLERLLAMPSELSGQSGLYNVFGRSRLRLVAVRLQDGALRVALRGRLVLGGMCDGPRVAAQLERTAGQMPGVDGVDIKLNGKPLSAAMSLQ